MVEKRTATNSPTVSPIMSALAANGPAPSGLSHARDACARVQPPGLRIGIASAPDLQTSGAQLLDDPACQGFDAAS